MAASGGTKHLVLKSNPKSRSAADRNRAVDRSESKYRPKRKWTFVGRLQCSYKGDPVAIDGPVCRSRQGYTDASCQRATLLPQRLLAELAPQQQRSPHPRLLVYGGSPTRARVSADTVSLTNLNPPTARMPNCPRIHACSSLAPCCSGPSMVGVPAPIGEVLYCNLQ